MQQISTVHNTIAINRGYTASPERVFAAFADSAKKRRWYAESQHHEVLAFELDFRPGGAERLQYRFTGEAPIKGMVLTTEGRHLDIVPNRRIVIAQSMSIGGAPFSAALITFEITPTNEGAALLLTHQGAYFDGADGPQRREQGWRALLDRLDGVVA